MKTTTPEGRRQPPPSSPAPFDLVGAQDCTGGGGWWSLKACGAPSPPPAGPGESRTLWNLWVVVACLSFPTLFFVSGFYRAPLAFVSSIAGGSAAWQQLQHHHHQERVVDGTAPPVASPSDSIVAELHSVGETAPPLPFPSYSIVAELHSLAAPSPAPTSGEKLSHAMLNNATEPAPSPAPVASGTPVGQLRNTSTAGAPSPSSHAPAHDDKFLGGLIAAGFDESSCQSRYRSYGYRKASPHSPSPYLLQRLREYEALHRRCGPLTRSYKRTLRLLKPGGSGGAAVSSCKYVVWNGENGLGNRMLGMASAFLYALLSKRVLLVDGLSTDLGGLFCEPFLGSTWLLPLDFPLQHLPLGQKYPKSYGNLLRTHVIGMNGGSAPVFVYAHLSNDYSDYDKRFYCEDDQLFLEKIPWMVLRSDQYFVPALFLNPAFERELVRMFPEKEAVFHHLGRYLFHPSNEVWGLITGYYRDHLATARERLGIQIRVFDNKHRPFDLILSQILNCTMSEKLLPEVDLTRHATTSTGGPSKAVLLASLHSVFYDKMKKVYSEHPAVGGEVVSFHQPSHEEQQRTGRVKHDGKALAEMYLLSLADNLVTSSWSTFGYVAQALGGVTPWVLRGPVHEWVPTPTCVRDHSPEPCFHFPPDYDCKAREHVDTTKLLPYTRHCKDFRRGVKLVDVR